MSKPKQKAKYKNTYKIIENYVTVYDGNGNDFMIDIDDYYRLIELDRYWYVRSTVVNGRKEDYVVSKINYKHVKLHNFIMNPPKDMLVDHINGLATDNRKSNLRIVTPQQNAMNKAIQINNTSGYKGVHHVKRNNKWQARISFKGKRIVLGTFDTFEEAVDVRKIAEEKYFGEFNRREEA